MYVVWVDCFSTFF